MKFGKAKSLLGLESGVDIHAEKPDLKLQSALNFAKIQVGKYERWRHLVVANHELIVVPDYDTGTASITKGSRTVTLGGGAAPTADFKGRFFSHQKGSFTYEIRSVSGQDLILKTPVAEDSESGLTYVVQKVHYRLPSDVRLILPDQNQWNKPTIIEVFGYDEYAADYSQGQITLAKGSKTAVFSGGAAVLDNSFPGDIIDVQVREYRVRTVVSDTEITMVNRAVDDYSGKYTIKSDTPYKGMLVGIGKQDSEFVVRFDYIRSLFPMVSDEDDTELPVDFDRAILDWAKGEYKRMPPGTADWVNDVNIAQRHLQKLAVDTTLTVQSAELFPPAIPPGMGRGEGTGRVRGFR